jgi:hypothetical protein
MLALTDNHFETVTPTVYEVVDDRLTMVPGDVQYSLVLYGMLTPDRYAVRRISSMGGGANETARPYRRIPAMGRNNEGAATWHWNLQHLELGVFGVSRHGLQH